LNAAGTTPASFFAVSATGVLFYVPGTTGAAVPVTKLVDVARDGTRKPIAEVPGMAWFPRFSPDGKRLAYGMSSGPDTGDSSDLWVLDVDRGARTRATFTGNNRYYPVWTRDGTRLTHSDGSGSTNRVLQTLADGSGVNETLVDTSPRSFPTSWSPDGRVLALYTNGVNNTRDVTMLTVAGDKRTSAPFVATPFEERGAIFSPDGKWIAYVSNKTGQNDVFARPFPGPGAEVTLSVGGGQEPVWGPSGKELFYRHGSVLQVVRIEATASELKVSAPARVFDDPFRPDTSGAAGGIANYDIAPDGKHFVMVEEPKTPGAGSATAKLNVVTGWFDELKRRAPAK
jgi:Tol biopolymer transport system component